MVSDKFLMSAIIVLGIMFLIILNVIIATVVRKFNPHISKKEIRKISFEIISKIILNTVKIFVGMIVLMLFIGLMFLLCSAAVTIITGMTINHPNFMITSIIATLVGVGIYSILMWAFSV